jgi:hypothetical protein
MIPVLFTPIGRTVHSPVGRLAGLPERRKSRASTPAKVSPGPCCSSEHFLDWERWLPRTESEAPVEAMRRSAK